MAPFVSCVALVASLALRPASSLADAAGQPGYSYAHEFEFELDLILGGLERIREEE